MTRSLLFTITSIFFTANVALAHVGPKFNNGSRGSTVKPKGKLAANCLPSASAEELNINNTRALIQTGGDMWWNFTRSRYEIPKGSGHTALFAGALWLGGRDVSGQLKVAAQRFRSQGVDFFTGPLSTVDAEITQATCAEYDKHFVTTRIDVQNFVNWFELGREDAANGTNKQAENFPNYSPPKFLYEWPAHGRDFAPFNEDFNLAPFVDVNNDGEYNPDNGDYPAYDLNNSSDCKAKIVNIYGDQNLWWVFNDKGNVHTETGAASIGMEIRAQAFAFATDDEVNNMTFYNYELINRSTFTLTETYFGQWVDADLGCAQDDYVGCDVQRGLGYAYNGDNDDEDCSGATGYGALPPAIGVDFFQGPFQDADSIDNPLTKNYSQAVKEKGIPYKGIGIGYGDEVVDNERFGMRKFLYHNIGRGIINDPNTGVQYYNYLRSLWIDGSRMVYGGNGHSSTGGTVEADYMFPGNTDSIGWGTGGIPQPEWTEVTAGNPKGDRRFMQSAGPFTLKPGAVNNITVGVVWARATTGDNWSSVQELRRADDKTQALFDNCFQLLNGPDAPVLEIEELENELVLYLKNEVVSNNKGENYQEQDVTLIPPGVDSMSTPEIKEYQTYRFQGYKIYQVFDNSVGPSELGDVNKARLIAQVDVKDTIKRLVNTSFDQSLGINVGTLEVDGENKGIRTSFSITQDAFAQGDNKLINHRAYYFMAVAYAANMNSTNRPYVGSRKGALGPIQPVKAIPHNVRVQNGGATLKSKYGDGVEITRIEGAGNGGNSLELNKATLDKILKDGKADSITYLPGSGPVNIKVVNPLKVKPGTFTLWFLDSTTTGDLSDSYWMITQEGNKDTVFSTNTIKVGTETIIFDMGISLTIAQVEAPASSAESRKSGMGIISVTNKVADSASGAWLSGVPDQDISAPLNWILSGNTAAENVATSRTDESVYDDWNTYMNRSGTPPRVSKYGEPLDPSQVWESQLGGTVAPFRLTAYRSSNGPVPGYLNANMQHYNPVTDYRNHLFLYDTRNAKPLNENPFYFLTMDSINQLNHLSSVDVVFTDNKDLWTRCPVLEMRDSLHESKGNSIRGQLRDAPSVDKNGVSAAEGASASNDPNDAAYIGARGMGWFPGYAINLETGERLNMAFGEDSYLAAENGADMLWNPTSKLTEGPANEIRAGGMHFVYVFRNNIIEDEVFNADMVTPGTLLPGSPRFYNLDINKPEFRMPAYDAGKFAYEKLKNVHGYLPALSITSPDSLKKIHDDAMSVFRAGMYVLFPRLEENRTLLESDVTIQIRMERPYRNRGSKAGTNKYLSKGEKLEVGKEYYVNAGPVKHFISSDKDSVFYTGDHFVAAGTEWKAEYRDASFGGNDSANVLMTTINGGRPLYNFNLSDAAPIFNQNSVASSQLDEIRVVPNPYYAYSKYEADKIDTRVKVINLPKTCTLRFYTVNGTLVRTLKKDDDSITYLEWDLKNQDRVPISSGVYIIHVDAPGVGEKVLKFMGVMRPVDLDNF